MLIGYSALSPNNILQWNLNSFKSKFNRLETIIGEYKIKIIALQETKNPTDREIKIRGFNV